MLQELQSHRIIEVLKLEKTFKMTNATAGFRRSWGKLCFSKLCSFTN